MRILSRVLGLLLLASSFHAFAATCNDSFAYSGPLNGNWTLVSGALNASSGTVAPANGATGFALCNGGGALANDQTMTVTVAGTVNNPSSTWLAIRMSTAASGYAWGIKNGIAGDIFTLSSGGFGTTICAGCMPVVNNGDTVTFQAVGTTITAKNVTAGTSASVTDSSYSSGYAGFEVSRSGSPFTDAFSAFSSGDYVPQAATPTFSPTGPRLPTGGGNITIACSTPSSTIYYTTNGSTPTHGSSVYSTPVPITVNATLKAICAASGYLDSDVASQTYAVGSVNWYVRSDGGTRYSSGVTSGQCDGLADAAYPGAGTNQHCAFNQFPYLWQDGTAGSSFPAWGWVIAGGDTVVVRGCAAGGQQNPDAPHCRVGYFDNIGNSPTNFLCWFSPYGSNQDCRNPIIPAGTSSTHTKILGGCAYDSTSCAGSNKAQIFSGFGAQVALDLASTQYVDIDGIDLTTHNSSHCNIYGTPAYTHGCNNAIPGADDFGYNGLQVNNTTAHLTMTDVNVHGFTASGLRGEIGGAITMTRVNVSFNGHSGWNFDSTHTPNAAGSSIIGSYITMMGNGCIEEYPITDPIPMLACWDSNSGGFGDSWSGQDSDLDTFTCDHCVTMYNTKDGDIGPHTLIRVYSQTNSIHAFDMGQEWKWGSNGTVPQTVTFNNNLTISGCNRMSQPITGAPSTFGYGLGLFCRASANAMSPNISPGSAWNFYNNTFVMSSDTLLNIHCFVGATSGCASTINWKNNAVIGYVNIPFPGASGQPPAIFLFNDPSITITPSYSLEYGTRNGGCDAFVPSTNMVCTDPLFLNEPAQSVTAQSALDVFTNTVNTSSFYPTSSSPMRSAGTSGGPSTDYFGVAQTSPLTIGAVVFPSPTVDTPTFSPVAGPYASTQSVTISTVTSGATLCYTTDGSAPTANGSGTCTHGTTYSGAVSVSTSQTLKAVGSKSGDTDSAVGSAAYVINGAVATPSASPVGGSFVSTTGPITLSDATGGATICYRTDGVNPAATTPGTCDAGSTTYAGTFAFTTTTTLKFLATKAVYVNSGIVTETYTVTAPVAGAITISTPFGGSLTIQ